ncbi:hypothetical protein MY5147_007809 [Beauveria neobassiana]
MWRFVAFGEPRRRYRSDYLLPYHDALDHRPPASYTRHSGGIPAHPSSGISDRRECTYDCVSLEAMKYMEHGAFETWITNDATNVDRAILLDLLKTCVGCSDKAKAQLILKVEIEPPLDVSIVLRDFVRDMHRPQIVEATVEATVKVTVEAIVTALELKAGFGEIRPDDMWRVFSAENSNVAQLFLRWELDPDLKLEKRNSRTKGHIQQPAALLCAASVEPPPETRVPDNRRACLEMLLKHGLDPNSICMSVSGSALPMLSFAAETGNLEVMELLLEYGALIDFGQFGQGTALMHVLDCAQQNEDPIKCQRQLNTAMDLVEDGADVAPGGETAVTAIHMVIWFKSSAMLNLLFAYMQAGTRPLKYEHMDTPQYIKCMINRGYMGTATALIQAVECAAPDLVKTLLANGADVHQIDRLGRTALMMAARQLLRDEAGHNAFFYAGDERSRFAELVEKETLRRRKDAEDRRKAAEDRRKAVRDDSTAAADSAAEDTSAEDDSTSAEDDSTATADDSIAIEDDNIAAEDIAAEDDSTAVDGESNAQVTAVVEGDTQERSHTTAGWSEAGESQQRRSGAGHGGNRL